ncbi:hypothetical protein WICMUC_000972 [Wickerhamomyces mucosus]|uniref:Uncharacterized protein n=1 Tax=Wickerhamomyces mucosus TaxID=1378264 RepID=A0A9P8PVX5_9ASCO|nr:hypothetical protein WICMUC_000972 [Wickerhamomyces mucosus]
MTIPYFEIPLMVLLLKVTFSTIPVAPETVLILNPFCEFVIVFPVAVTPLTVLSDLPPTEPIEIPCPPEQEFDKNLIFVPELIAKQSS